MKYIFLLYILFIFQTSADAQTLTWAGPIVVVNDNFKQYGGVFGFTHSLDQGDCCCGGPATEDSYPDFFEVGINGNIIIRDNDEHQVLLFSAGGDLINTFTNKWSNDCDPGRTGFIWPSKVGFVGDKIFITHGYCSIFLSKDGDFLWSLGSVENEKLPNQGQFPKFIGVDNGEMVFKNYLMEPYFSQFSAYKNRRGEFDDGYHYYDQNGVFLRKKDYCNIKKQHQGNTIEINNVTYKNDDFNKFERGWFDKDNEGLLYVLLSDDSDDDNPEYGTTVNTGTFNIYDNNSNKIYNLPLPPSTYKEKKRTCQGDGYVAFAGRDVIQEFGRHIYTSGGGDIYATLYIPKGLKIIKWTKVDLDKKLSTDFIGKLSPKSLRLLLNEIYARKGRQFRSKDLSEYFMKQPWYVVDPNYSDSKLDSNDIYNIELISEKRKEHSI